LDMSRQRVHNKTMTNESRLAKPYEFAETKVRTVQALDERATACINMETAGHSKNSSAMNWLKAIRVVTFTILVQLRYFLCCGAFSRTI
jgi:hypothetical protein